MAFVPPLEHLLNQSRGDGPILISDSLFPRAHCTICSKAHRVQRAGSILLFNRRCVGPAFQEHLYGLIVAELTRPMERSRACSEKVANSVEPMVKRTGRVQDTGMKLTESILLLIRIHSWV